MRIGLLTLRLHFNYGGILQAYALQKFLQRLGYEVILIDRQSNESNLLDRIKKHVFKRVFRKRYREDREKSASLLIRPFIHSYFPLRTIPIVSDKQMHELVKEYSLDAIVVGSDQVWRPSYTKSLVLNYFLDFANEQTIKLSYAASFGEDKWDNTPELTEKLKSLLSQFNALSVREDSAVQICRTIFDRNSYHHVDPTLLLDQEDYLELVNMK